MLTGQNHNWFCENLKKVERQNQVEAATGDDETSLISDWKVPIVKQNTNIKTDGASQKSLDVFR